MFIAALFTIAKTRKRNKCPLTEEWIKKMWCVLCVLRCSIMSDFLQPPRTVALPGSSVHRDSLGKNTGMGCHALLQGIFPSQGLNLGILRLLHRKGILYRWATREAQLFVQLAKKGREVLREMVILLPFVRLVYFPSVLVSGQQKFETMDTNQERECRQAYAQGRLTVASYIITGSVVYVFS